ncbi:MAG: hypothetical protein H3C34_25450 [Caldilineaceae bacterium]|nr:hypothetical protein [Caldilineaceae bacterium]
MGHRRLDALQEILWLPATFQQYMLFLLVFGVIVAGMMVQIWLTVQTAEDRRTLRQLHAEYARIEQENSELVYAITTRTSLQRVKETAAQLQYIPATTRVYVRLHEVDAGTPTAALALAGEASPALYAPVAADPSSAQTSVPVPVVDDIGQTLDAWRRAVQGGIDQLVAAVTGR